MKAKTFFSNCLMLTIMVSLAQAAVWRLDSPTAGTDPDFNTMTDVLMSISLVDGDRLYLSGRISDDYGGYFTLEKRLHNFGPGYFLDQNPV